MPAPRKQLDLDALLDKGDVTLDLQVKTAEDEQEKSLRLRKDFLSFLVKELALYVMAIVFLTAIAIYCFAVLNRSGSTPDERQRAWSALSAIMGGMVGVLFGKSIK